MPTDTLTEALATIADIADEVLNQRCTWSAVYLRAVLVELRNAARDALATGDTVG